MAKAKKGKDGADDAAPAKKSKKKLIIVGVVILAAGWKLGFIPPGGGGEVAATGPTTTTLPPEGDLLAVDPMTVNLADTDVVHYARVGVAAVLREGQDPTLVEPRVGLIQDAVLFEVRTWTAEELMAPGGLELLRERLTEEVVDRFAAEPEPMDEGDGDGDGEMAMAEPAPGEVLRIVITEFVIQ